MNLLTAALNPSTKNLLALVGEIAGALGHSEMPAHEANTLIEKIRGYVPALKVLNRIKAKDASVQDLSELLNSVGVQMRAEDVVLWLNEIQSFADDAEETLSQFLFGPRGKKMLIDILSRSKGGADPQVVVSDAIPMYDPELGVFHFD